MECDVVFAHHVVMERVVVLPPVFPRVRLAARSGPLDGGGQISDDGVEPDIDLLVWVVLPTWKRHGDSPVQVARDGPWLEVADELERVLADVRAPVVVLFDPLLELVAELRQVEQEMLGLPKLDRRVASSLLWIDQVDGGDLIAAVVALIATRVGKTADRALALDVAIRKV